MFCPFCGESVTEDTSFCPSCGRDLTAEKEDAAPADVIPTPQQTPQTIPQPAPVPQRAPQAGPQQMPQPGPVSAPTSQHAAAPTDKAAPTPNPSAGERITSEQRKQIVDEAEKSGLGMKWYKFLIYFSLIAGAVVAVLMGISYMMGSTYAREGVSSAFVYGMFPQLRGIDIFTGLAFLATCALFVYTRMLLARFSKRGPKFLLICYVVYSAINIFYYLAISVSITGSAASNVVSMVVTAIACVVWVLINKKYFERRAHLFQYE